MKWFDRKFVFDAPTWMYPNLVERLRGTPARLEDRCASLSRRELVRTHDEAWSIQENVGHLLDLEELWRDRLDDFLRGSHKLREADLTNRATHEADHNSRDIGDLLAAFRAARLAMVERLEGADDELVERVAEHPRLRQPMRLLDHLHFVAEHDDHHLATITRLLRGESGP